MYAILNDLESLTWSEICGIIEKKRKRFMLEMTRKNNIYYYLIRFYK